MSRRAPTLYHVRPRTIEQEYSQVRALVRTWDLSSFRFRIHCRLHLDLEALVELTR